MALITYSIRWQRRQYGWGKAAGNFCVKWWQALLLHPRIPENNWCTPTGNQTVGPRGKERRGRSRRESQGCDQTGVAASPDSVFEWRGKRHPFLSETKPGARVLGMASGALAGFWHPRQQGQTCMTPCSAQVAEEFIVSCPRPRRISASLADEGFGE